VRERNGGEKEDVIKRELKVSEKLITNLCFLSGRIFILLSRGGVGGEELKEGKKMQKNLISR
jgi:hypothetical protein